jgi:hypothetical protein
MSATDVAKPAKRQNTFENISATEPDYSLSLALIHSFDKLDTSL